MSTLALLVFHRNQRPGLQRLISTLGPVVDEILIVDSSDPPEFEGLEAELGSESVRFVRALPLACTEPLRPWAMAQLSSDRVLALDCDEEPSAELVAAVRDLDSTDAYLIPRYEQSIRAYSDQLRLYRRGAVRYSGTIHESPEVLGLVGRLSPPLQILHHADYRRYLDGTDARRSGYLRVEAYVRPFRATQLRKEYTGRLARILTRRRDDGVGPVVAHLLAASHRVRRYNPRNGIRGNYLTGKYLAAYVRSRYRFFRSLPPDERQRAADIAGEAERAGGVVRYLEFDRPGYLEGLTRSFSWDRDGALVFTDLLRYRHAHGAPLPSWQSRDHPPGAAL